MNKRQKRKLQEMNGRINRLRDSYSNHVQACNVIVGGGNADDCWRCSQLLKMIAGYVKDRDEFKESIE